MSDEAQHAPTPEALASAATDMSAAGQRAPAVTGRSDLPPANATSPSEAVGEATLPPAARRALAEAAERREKAGALNLAPELGGRDGPEPVRYGDWEKKGLAVDF